MPCVPILAFRRLPDETAGRMANCRSNAEWNYEYSLIGATTRVIVPPGLGWSGFRPHRMDANKPIN
jgi:hypothetical protein